MKFFHRICIIAQVLICAGGAQSRELEVGSVAYPTIQSAVDAALPGDTIKLERQKAAYFESVSFQNKSGSATKPITLDGQGSTLDGSEVLRSEEWQEAAPGIYRSSALPIRLKMEPAILMRYFFIFDGEVNRMGHVSKGVVLPYKEWKSLESGEWTYAANEKAFYLRPKTGQNLESVRAPILGAGVSLMGNCEWLNIRNLSVARFWNDGFNIHGRSREIQFFNIRALDCGDDGISAHEDCWTTVDGLVSRGNATGFCHVGNSRTWSRNVFIENCAAFGVFLLDASRHELENAVIRSKSGSALSLLNGTELKMKDVLFVGTSASQTGLVVASRSGLVAHNISVWNLPLTVTNGRAQWFESVVASGRVSVDAKAEWFGDRNLWDVAPGSLSRFESQEADSKVQSVTATEVLKGGVQPHGFHIEKVPWYPAGEPYVD